MKTKYTIKITVESWNNHEIDMALLLEQAQDAAEYLHLGTTTIRGDVIQDGIDGPQVSEVTDDQEPAKTDPNTINIKPSNLDTVNGYMGLVQMAAQGRLELGDALPIMIRDLQAMARKLDGGE